jgi:hypothetical protein
VTVLLIILLVWVGSAALVVPYLLHVSKLEVEQTTSQSPTLDLPPPDKCADSSTDDPRTLPAVDERAMPQIAGSTAQGADQAKMRAAA